MAASAASSALNWVKGGCTLVDDSLFNARFEICKSCKDIDPIAFAGGGRCLQCGCALKVKLRLSTERCPAGKWG